MVQHCAGERGAGGPVTALEHVLASRLSRRYHFVRMHQSHHNGGLNVRLLRDWVGLLRTVRPDLVHVRGLQNEGLHGVLAARLAGCRRILVTIHGTVRDLQAAGPSWRRLLLIHGAEAATLRAASHIATVCGYAAQRDFLRPYAPKFLGVVANGVPLPPDPGAARHRVRAANGLDPDTRVMITVSRLTWEKGFATLAAALRRLATRPAVHLAPYPAAHPCAHPAAQPGRRVLLVVGDGPDRPGIEAALGGIPGLEVRFLGQRLDVGDLLSAADLFVFATLHENLSLALLEAMAHGLPVVASAVGGNIEILSRGGGLLVAPRDPQALADAIGCLLDNDLARRDLGHSARQVVARHYSLEAMLGSLDAMYQRVLHQHVPGRVGR